MWTSVIALVARSLGHTVITLITWFTIVVGQSAACFTLKTQTASG